MGKRKPVYLEDVADEHMRMAQLQQRQVRRWQEQEEKKQRAAIREGEPIDIDIAGINAMEKLTRSIASIMREIRALEKSAGESATRMGAGQLEEYIFNWFMKLTEAHQYSHILDLKAIYDKRRKRVLPEDLEDQNTKH